MVTLEHERNYLKMQKRLMIIRRFAKEMGYTTHEDEYHSDYANCTYRYIELIGSEDSDGEPFTWEWRTDTWEEV